MALRTVGGRSYGHHDRRGGDGNQRRSHAKARPGPAGDAPINGNVFVVGVAHCQGSFDAALAAGGTQALPVTDMPGVGIMAYVKDPDGNVFGIIEPTMPPQD